MKTILSAALVLGVCGLVSAADKVDPVGTWKCEYEIGDMKRTSTLTIKKDGDKLVGTMSWPDQKDEKLKDVKLKDSTLTFSAVRKFMGNDIPIDYKFTITGDKLKGKGEAEFGGNKQEFDIEAKREKKDK
jgi:major membrane immunogen (membrane-anchored lipoprotein)